MKKALIQRYDNEPDILAIADRGYSDVFTRSARDDFEIVIVVPTVSAQTDMAVVADAASEQYYPVGGEPWPGKPDSYAVRVDLGNVRYTTRDRVRAAVLASGANWAGPWPVRFVERFDERLLFEDVVERWRVRENHASYGETALPGEEAGAPRYREGAMKQVTVNAYERNPKARSECIRHYGPGCSACGFDFGETYGDVAETFIHVHHVRPLSEISDEYEVDPVADLRPVCPNCHAVIHLRAPAFTVEEVQQLLASRAARERRDTDV